MDPELKQLLDPKYSAVLVIDIQNDACHPEGAYARRGRDISLRQGAAHKAAEFIKAARRFNVPVIFTKAIHNQWVESPTWLKRHRRTQEPGYLEGTWGAEFYAVKPLNGEAIVVKHRYSAFFRTDLETILRSRGISTLLLTGGGTGACVESTARDGFMLDYDIIVVSDCCGTTTLKDHVLALERMTRLCGTVLESNEILEQWTPL